MIDCTEKENTLMYLMVKALGVDSNLPIKKAFEWANILMLEFWLGSKVNNFSNLNHFRCYHVINQCFISVLDVFLLLVFWNEEGEGGNKRLIIPSKTHMSFLIYMTN